MHRLVRIRALACATGLALVLPAAQMAQAQSWPVKPVRVYTSSAGGGNDFVARIVSQGLAPVLGQPVVVENRAGIIAVETVSKASPDGYSLLVIGSSLWVDPLMNETPAWDPVRDFAPVSLAVISPNVLVTHPSVPAKSVKELIALAKARPGELNFASAGSGSTPHIAAELFKYMAGVEIVRVMYKSTNQALNDLIAGQVQMTFTPGGTAMGHVKAGKLNALGVTSLQASALFPGLAPIAAAGVPGYEAVSTYGLFAPAKTSAAIVTRLNQEVVKTLAQPAVREKLLATGSEAVGSSPEELAAKIKSEMARLAKVLKPGG